MNIADKLNHDLLPPSRRANLAPIWILLGGALLAAPFGALAAAPDREELLPTLADDFLKSGPEVLRAFRPLNDAARGSVALLSVDGRKVALATVVDPNGLLITKASELKPGVLTCQLAGGRDIAATAVATNEQNDLCLIKIALKGLKPVVWAAGDTTVGQWVMTPALGTKPEAVGIISVPVRQLHRRALIGVILDINSESPAQLDSITPGFGADKAGLKARDIILAVNGKSVATRTQLTAALREIREGRTVKLRVKRGEKEFDADVEMTGEATVMAEANRADQPGGRRGGRGFGQGGLDRADRMNRMGGTLSKRAEDFELAVQHDTVLEPWQCGGPLLNLDGKAVGINIARAGRVASYALPAALVKRIVDELSAKSKTGHN